ncbi:MAG: hypothetical protein AAF488_08830 [Planctomycetota bacterium]
MISGFDRNDSFNGLLGFVGSSLYRAIAYEKHGFPGTTFTVYNKRTEWLPGERSLTSDQECAACQLENHKDCFMGHVRFLETTGQRGWFTTAPLTDVQITPFICECNCEHSVGRP